MLTFQRQHLCSVMTTTLGKDGDTSSVVQFIMDALVDRILLNMGHAFIRSAVALCQYLHGSQFLEFLFDDDFGV